MLHEQLATQVSDHAGDIVALISVAASAELF
jgi:hypothetical protein